MTEASKFITPKELKAIRAKIAADNLAGKSNPVHPPEDLSILVAKVNEAMGHGGSSVLLHNAALADVDILVAWLIDEGHQARLVRSNYRGYVIEW